MKQIALILALFAAAFWTAGCCPNSCQQDSSAGVDSVDSNVENADEQNDASQLEMDDAPLDVEDPESPEGVVNAFFKAFFSGDDEAAFQLLSPVAQDAQREQFTTQASDSIRWRIIQKTKARSGRVLALVEVEDYAESGELQMDTLTFVLTRALGHWRIAAFTVGEIAVNFEDNVIDVIAQDDEETQDDLTRVSQHIEGSTRYR